MSRPVLAIALAAAASLFAAAAAAQIHRWVDKDGKVHYTDTPPPASAKNVQERSATPSVVETSQQPYAVQQAVKNFPVVLYTHADCKEPCADGRRLLAGRGVPYREVAVVDEKSQAELKRASGDVEVPVLMVGRQVTKGYEAGMWNAALDAAGYPKSAPLGAQARQPAEPAGPAEAEAAPGAAKAEKPQQAAAEPAPTGRYAPLPPDPKAPAAPAKGKYLPQ